VKGSYFAGYNKQDGYLGVWLFPIGIEIMIDSMFLEVAFVIQPLELCLTFKLNNSLFRRD
tara:strand:+ start:304 stop:483 length:180 start_codon:yes stop_codon:yes gene_type:complete